ncbi:MAG: putative toxin-antitoxin system toxin component, PIN family [Candidatus Aerophobetes bacterium]|nr:putative toxin-antitoxin system toxin component, PIN family [Candidatus Aerophobetes bacterium]
MIRVVLDTNVLVSATLFGGKPEKIMDLVEEGKIELIISKEITGELKGVLQRKFGFSQGMAEITASNIREVSKWVSPTRKVDVIKEKEADNRILECAVEGRAGYIVSGDKRHLLPLKEYKSIKILSPAQFLRRISQEASSGSS